MSLKIFAFSFLLGSALSSSVTDPVIWVNTHHRVATGATEYTAALGILDRCDAFYKSSVVLAAHSCELIYKEEVNDELASACTLSSAAEEDSFPAGSLHRKKRSPLVPLLIAGAAYLDVNTYLDFTSRSNYRSLRKQVLNYESITSEALKRSLNGISEANSILEAHGNVLVEMEGKLANLSMRMASQALRTNLHAKFGSIGRKAAAVLTDFNERKYVSSRFLSVFPNSVLCKNCPLDLWEPQSCSYSPVTNNLVLTVKVKYVNSELQVLQSRPVRLAFSHYDTHGVPSWCFVQYFGPSFALFDTRTRCATPLPWAPITTDEPFVGSHSGVKCNTSMSPAGDRWKLTGCQLANTIDESTLVQTVLTAHNVFVYCPSFNLTYMGVTVQCGQKVFRLADNLPWQAGPVDWTYTNLTRSVTESFSADLTEMVNEKLNPYLHHSDMLLWAQEKIKENLKLNVTVSRLSWGEEAEGFLSPKLLWAVILLSLTLVIVFCWPALCCLARQQLLLCRSVTNEKERPTPLDTSSEAEPVAESNC